MKKLKLDDTIIARVAQMLQEAMLMGYDVTDNMRTMIVVESADEDGKLTLDKDYMEKVKAEHEALIARAEELKTSS